MKKYIIGIILVFVLLLIFTTAKLEIGGEAEPNYVWLNMPNITIPLDLPSGTVDYSETFGKITLKTTFSLSDFPLPNEVGRETNLPIEMYYDVYATGDADDVFIYETHVNGYAYVSTTQNAIIYRDVKAYIPYSAEYFFTSISRGYASILDNLRVTFNKGFPTLPNSNNVLDYVVYIGKGLFHSIQSVAVTFDFVVFPICIMRGAFL